MITDLSRWIHILSDRVNRGVELFLFAIGFSMAILAGVQVFCRYVLNHSLFWSEELGRIFLVWITFLGASTAYKRHAHIGIDFVVSRLSLRARRVCEAIVLTMSSIFFMILVIYGLSFSRFISAQKTAALGIPQGIPYLVIPLSGLLFLLHGLSRFLQLLETDKPAVDR